MTYSYIDSDRLLIGFRQKLHKNNIKAICMDFEGEFNLHCYGEKLCLIQVFDGRAFYVIDPFHISKTELKKTLESNVIKLFYSAGSDRKLVFNQYGIRIKSLLDIADLAAVIDPRHGGLSSIIEEVLSVNVEKKKNYQKHNWTLRPVAEDAIQYALSDVRYLFELKDALLKKIQENDLVEALAYRLAKAEFDYEKKNEPGVKKKTRYSKFNQKEQSVFDIVFRIREKFAQNVNKPPNSVLDNEQVFQIAENRLDIADARFGKAVPIPVRKKMIQEISAALPAATAE